MESSLEQIGAALGRIPSGCAILTVRSGDVATGILVSWFQQASFTPPSVTVALRRGRAAANLIDASQRFLLNIIGEKDVGELFRHFGKGFDLGEDAFEGLSTIPTEFGPRIASCIAHLGCELIRKFDVGDHDLYLAQVKAGAVIEGAESYTHLRRTGLSY